MLKWLKKCMPKKENIPLQLILLETELEALKFLGAKRSYYTSREELRIPELMVQITYLKEKLRENE